MKWNVVYRIGIVWLCFGNMARAQDNINRNWYFGNAGLHFGTVPPTLLSDNAMDGIVSATEGSASISDTSGNILFYTDGDTVYNKLHQPMPNGFDLGGSFSTAQPASIVQWPDDDNRYVIFTTHGPNQEGAYSVVDMTLQNGLGDITNKNVFITDSSMEALLVIPHRECGKYWVLYRIEGTDRFEAFLFDADGLHSTPVASHAGNIPPPNSRVAYLSHSPDRSLLAFSCIYDTVFSLLRFDDATGQVSDFVNVQKELVYASCFSPDNRLVYISHSRWDDNLLPDAATNLISQYNLSSGQPAVIAGSRITVDSLQSATNGEFGQMRVGPDGVLYTVRAWSGALGTIQHPDVAGTGCQYTRDAFSLAPKNTWLGLPAVAYGNPFVSKPNLGPDVEVCQGPLTLAPQNQGEGMYSWNTGDTGVPLTATESGTYILTATLCGISQSDTVTVTVKNTGAGWTVPNIFTPNNDGINDVITPLMGDCGENSFYLYNRWGNLIYTYSSGTPTFNGKTTAGSPLSPGVYFYVYTQGNKKNEGAITLIR